MGNVNMKYKATRGSHDAGTEINNGEDFFKVFRESYFAELKPRYDQMDQAKKDQFMAIFGGMDVMRDQNSILGWINENEDDEDTMDAAMNQVKAFMASC